MLPCIAGTVVAIFFGDLYVGATVVAIKMLCPAVLPTNDDEGRIIPCCSVSAINNRAYSYNIKLLQYCCPLCLNCCSAGVAQQ